MLLNHQAVGWLVKERADVIANSWGSGFNSPKIAGDLDKSITQVIVIQALGSYPVDDENTAFLEKIEDAGCLEAADGNGNSASFNRIILTEEVHGPPSEALIEACGRHKTQFYDKRRQTSVKEGRSLPTIVANGVGTIPFGYVNKIICDCFDNKMMHPLFMTLSEATIDQLHRYLASYCIFEPRRHTKALLTTALCAAINLHVSEGRITPFLPIPENQNFGLRLVSQSRMLLSHVTNKSVPWWHRRCPTAISS